MAAANKAVNIIDKINEAGSLAIGCILLLLFMLSLPLTDVPADALLVLSEPDLLYDLADNVLLPLLFCDLLCL